MASARRRSGVRRWLAVSRKLDHDGEGRAAPLVEVVALSILADQQLARTLILDRTWLEDTSHAGVPDGKTTISSSLTPWVSPFVVTNVVTKSSFTEVFRNAHIRPMVYQAAWGRYSRRGV
jgi:hypothetical protein